MDQAAFESALAARGVTMTAWTVSEWPVRTVRIAYVRDNEPATASFSGEDDVARQMLIAWLDRAA